MKTNTTVSPEIQRRFLAVDEPIVKDDLLTISVSSEFPVERGFYLFSTSLTTQIGEVVVVGLLLLFYST